MVSLPLKKTLCLLSITPFISLFNLFAKNFACILYMQPTKDIGQNSQWFCGSSTFGTRVIKEALVPLGSV